ncbi:MAG TPA: IS630 transposase-related protein [Chloroflexota bacterium]|nr:IS630 transposase-related protein [Chloroflexota bacterium]
MVHHLAMKAYSVDLRERIVAAVRGGMSKAQAARTFGVGATSVKRYVSLAEQGRSLGPGKAPGRESKLGESGMRLLEEDLHERPTVTYESRARLLHRLLGIEVSKATICRTIKQMGYTRKKDCDHGARSVSPRWSDPKKEGFVPFQRSVDRFGGRRDAASWSRA